MKLPAYQTSSVRIQSMKCSAKVSSWRRSSSSDGNGLCAVSAMSDHTFARESDSWFTRSCPGEGNGGSALRLTARNISFPGFSDSLSDATHD